MFTIPFTKFADECPLTWLTNYDSKSSRLLESPQMNTDAKSDEHRNPNHKDTEGTGYFLCVLRAFVVKQYA
jgi:hypothetical protein